MYCLSYKSCFILTFNLFNLNWSITIINYAHWLIIRIAIIKFKRSWITNRIYPVIKFSSLPLALNWCVLIILSARYWLQHIKSFIYPLLYFNFIFFNLLKCLKIFLLCLQRLLKYKTFRNFRFFNFSTFFIDLNV